MQMRAMSPSGKPVIAIAGLGTETSTFSPARTRLSDFRVLCDAAILEANPFLQSSPVLSSARWVPIIVARALPGGVVKRDAFETLAGQIVAGLTPERAELDGIWLDLHGAMVVEGVDDAEAELVRRVRALVGPDVLVSASMDLHGNVSRELIHLCDLLTCYRTAPHVDVLPTRERACENLINLLDRSPRARLAEGTTYSGTIDRPFKAWIPVPVLLGGEQTSTRVEPAKGIYATVDSVADTAGIIDASVWVGYAWADEERNRAAVVVTGWDRDAVAAGAERLARMYWDARKDFSFVAPTGSYTECLDAAVRSGAKKPFFISDSGDNPTAGGAGDVTWGLARLLERDEFKDKKSRWTVIYASLPAPKAVEAAVAAGVGATVTVTAGADVDSVHEGPVTLTGKIYSIKHGDRYAGVEVVIQVGGVCAILTHKRKPYHFERDFTDLNLDPRHADIVIVKIGYLEPELFDMAADWMMALTPGGVDQDLERLGHKRIRRPMWPFEKAFDREPNLRARFIPPSTQPLDGPDE